MATSAVATAFPPARLMAFQLTGVQGAYRGQIIFIEDLPFMIGREQHCDLQLPDLEVSRLHCVIKCEHDQLYVQDLGSRNGTQVNLRRISESAILNAGDLLSIGRTVLKIEKAVATEDA